MIRYSLVLVVGLLVSGCFGPTLFSTGFVKITASDVATSPFKVQKFQKMMEKDPTNTQGFTKNVINQALISEKKIK